MTTHWRAGSTGVDLLLSEWERRLSETPREVPHCPHGPLLLFRRWYAEGESRLFWVCSASRGRARSGAGGGDSKGSVGECAAFCWDDRRRHSPANDVYLPWRSHGGGVGTPGDNDTHFCVTCQKLVGSDHHVAAARTGRDTAAPTSASSSHDRSHHVVRRKDVTRPTELLRPLARDTANAQYFFSSSATKWTIEQLVRLGVRRVVCIGTPSVHEAWLAHHDHGVDNGDEASGPRESLLLDLDERFSWFGDCCAHGSGDVKSASTHARQQYARFNMATCHFLGTPDGNAPVATALFLARSEAIVVDPPFGLHPAALGRTLRLLWAAASQDGSGTELPTLLYFPYETIPLRAD